MRKYELNRKAYKDVKKMDHGQMSLFCEDLYKRGYEAGKQEVLTLSDEEITQAILQVKGIGEKTAAQIVARFGVGTLDILEKSPERLLEIRGITEDRLQDIKTSYRESRMLRDIMALLAPFRLTPKTAQKIYEHFGPACLDILRKSPFELCLMPGFGFRRVDAIVQKTESRPHDPMRITGALHCALTEAKGNGGHLYLEKEELYREALRLLNERAPLPAMRVREGEVDKALEEMILVLPPIYSGFK